ncbi:L,D-transpeptidase family protein [Hespellia stercorisuis]|uniref:Peptidoglycan transpeptidase, ErfK-YbiS-YhnG family n=1 Tax=Hespellia stercorisuis DSM 15480 TaxID=1121950 RepID=A0A1M6LX10_9FIRM|nr:L,D-transpeptidase family protein [Hespellia stercorisuis]SHJ75719.1 peptidoglycan transpeptidase precursor, ErfK-YbiS-YhnG family [Hespellia stercorisuis DSM 15480]
MSEFNKEENRTSQEGMESGSHGGSKPKSQPADGESGQEKQSAEGKPRKKNRSAAGQDQPKNRSNDGRPRKKRRPADEQSKPKAQSADEQPKAGKQQVREQSAAENKLVGESSGAENRSDKEQSKPEKQSAEGQYETEDQQEDNAIQKKRRKKKKNIEDQHIQAAEAVSDPESYDDADDLFGADDPEPDRKGFKIAMITLASIVGILAVAYIGISVFFMSHFYFNTKINGIDFSTKTVADVEKYVKEQVKDYQLVIDEKNNVKETISGEDIGLSYVENNDIKKALDAQVSFLWPKAFFSKNSAKVTIDVSYDKEKLSAALQQLKCISEVEQVDPVSAYPKFANGAFAVEPEVPGTKVDMDRFTEEANKYVSSFKTELNMEEDGCYVMPKYTSESPEVQAACDKMNSYCKASITYNMSPNTEVVDATLISAWVTCDENMNVTFNHDAVAGYMAELGQKYDTVKTTRNFTSISGAAASVSGGTYGWSIDEATETQNLIASIEAGEVATREPAYEQTAASHDAVDWGNTYIEVNLSSQHMWYVVDGVVNFEADIVSGLPTPEKATPTGVYQILEKESPSILKGEIQQNGEREYETEVTFWMRITWSGIGFHDATWQSWFGGDNFTVNGSHGCLNMSYNDAQTLYSMINIGLPVIVYN